GNNIYTQENGVFTLANERLPNFGATLETRKILVFDANGDEVPDLYYCNVGWVPGASLPNRLLINDGTGFFEDVSSTHLPTQTGFTLDAVALDIDGDDDLDLVTTNLGQPGMTLRAYRNEGAGVFTSATIDFFPNFLYSEGIALHLFDANGDEFPDIYFGNHSNTDKLALYLPTALSAGEKKIEKTSITLLGNPVSHQVEANLEQDMDKVQVISSDGIVLWSQATVQRGILKILCSDWSAGTYFLQAEVNGQILTQPFIKMN
ncbi:MAG: T9SS type A sorting domain-containing protein, partial [Bacteroidota bacterium]